MPCSCHIDSRYMRLIEASDLRLSSTYERNLWFVYVVKFSKLWFIFEYLVLFRFILNFLLNNALKMNDNSKYNRDQRYICTWIYLIKSVREGSMIYKYIILLLKLFVLSKFSLNSDYPFWKSSVEMGWTKLFNLLEGTWLLVKMTKIHLNCMLSFFCTRTFFITIYTILRFL